MEIQQTLHIGLIWAVIGLVSAIITSCGGEAPQSQPPTGAVTPSVVPTATPGSGIVSPKSTVIPTPPNTPTGVPKTVPSVTPITPSASPVSTIPTVTIGGVSFTVDVADTPEKRFQGLSGRPVLEDGTGMLFIFQEERKHTFWMKDMRFPLDMVWINAACSVADITADIPNPLTGQADGALPTYSPSAAATYNLEINAGVAAASGLKTGDAVAFGGSLTGRFGC